MHEGGIIANILFRKAHHLGGHPEGQLSSQGKSSPREGLGIVKIADEGSTAKLMWGFSGGGRPTSEFVAHLRSHEERLKTDPLNRVVLHSHPTNLICMSMVHDLDEREFTRTLWRMLAEAVIVFPDGIGILPFMCFGTKEIGQKTAEKIKSFRIVLWANHGIYGAGKDINEAFGLIDTVEKAAEVYPLFLPVT